ncbi:MAG TPA: hypothetical protein EYN91_26970 [Candidatus Melainabacteria bacterium]|nr:hypothetical protein [Candidatus Melainabacteria bacterium]HIN64947.1 hypothetical protein [Candidatus Obscuribacterales bacterium]
MLSQPHELTEKTDAQAFKLRIGKEFCWAILTAITICLLLFPDVIFLRAGLSQTSQFMGAKSKRPAAVFYPQPSHRLSQDAYSDAGGALWQSEPAQQFLRYCLNTHESPYWNPYSGAGQLGPETLVDLKFSFQTFLIALFKGSQTAFNFVVIGSYILALFCMYLFCSRFLQVSKLASICSCIVFAFCGYNTATLATNTSQAYIYYPLLLCALAAFCKQPSAIKWVILVLLDAIILSATFLPTCFLMLLTAHAIAFAFAISLQKFDWRTLICLIALQLAALIFALLGLGFLYFPIIESLFYVDAVSMYNARTFCHASHNSVLSFFSSKHFWEEYCALPTSLVTGAPHNNAISVTNSMYHFGAAASMVAACAASTRGQLRPVSIACIALLVASVGRIFGVPIIDQLISITPGLKSLGEQYWFICTACAFVVAVPLGIEAISNNLPKAWVPAVFVGSITLAAMAFLYFNYGFVQPNIEYKKYCVTVLLAAILVALSLILLTAVKPASTKTAGILILAIMSGELIFDMMYYRHVKTDYFQGSSIAIQRLKQNSDLGRTVNLNIGIVPAEQGSAFQIQQIETMNMNILPTYEAFFHRYFVNKSIPAWGRFCTFFNMVEQPDKDWQPQLNMPMCNLLGVRNFVVSAYWSKTRKFLEEAGCRKYFFSTTWDIYENPNAFPRAFAASAIEDSKVIKQDSCRTTAFSSDKTLLKDAQAAGVVTAAGGVAQLKTSDTACKITSYHNDSVVIDAVLEQPSIVVLTDNWHPNWTAKLDGKPVYVGLVDETFRGVVVPKGTHRIEMHYRPKSLTAGIAASVLVLVFLLAVLLFRKTLDSRFSNPG